jgi:uncharacterized membrane protein YozB (DUF420 family)
MSSVSSARARLNWERVYYLSMVAAIFAIIFSGFSQSVFLRPLFPNVVAAHEPLFYAHGAVFFTWIALLMVQVSLIAAGNPAMHRRLGAVGFVLVPLMLVVGVYAALVAARRPTGFTGVTDTPVHFLGVLIAMIFMFVTYASLALIKRHDPQTHKRLMLLAAFTLAEVGVSRWPFDFIAASEMVAFWVTAPLLVPMVVWDLATLRRLHPATLWGGLAFLAYGPLRDMAASSSLWQSIGKWAMGLLG